MSHEARRLIMTTLWNPRHEIMWAALAFTLAAGASLMLSSPAAAAERADARLGRVVRDAIREGGPFFDAGERATIERKCGYAPGSWDGFEATMLDGVLHCTNGRRLDDAETRAIMERARPRIERRVEAVMRRADVDAAIEAVADEAEARALRELEARRRR
jgi:hypothetical protein